MSHSKEGSIRVIVIALGANFAIAVAKFIGASITRSTSLFAEAIHSLVDCANQGLLLFGARASARPATDKHPLGHGRETFFWGFMVAILLFSLGGMFAIYEGVEKTQHLEPLASPRVALGILLFAIAVEGYSFFACLKEVRAQNPYPTLFEWFQHTTSAELLVIFTEDLAALLGLIIAAACVLLSWITHNPAWDAFGSIAVGSLLVGVAVLLAAELKSLLIGESPATPELRGELERLVREHIDGGQLLRLIALQTGSSEIMIAYKVTHGTITDARALIDALNRLEVAVKQRFPAVRWQFIEPDIKA